VFDLKDRYDKDSTWDSYGYLRDLREKSGLSIYEAVRRVPHTSVAAVMAAEDGKVVGVSLLEALERVYMRETERRKVA
jgi:hypothetical protein